MRKAKRRTLQLNAQLAQTLTEKGIEATAEETTTALVDKVAEISGGSEDNYYDTFWDNFQRNGEKTDYKYAFNNSGWNDYNFKPKYDIKPTGHIENIFSGCKIINLTQALKESGVILDTSKATHFNYAFSGSSTKNIPEISLVSMTDVVSGVGIFYICYYLETIDKIIVAKESQLYSNMFFACRSLKNVTFEGEIGFTLNIKDSPLTVESAKSIITHLVNYAGTENEFVYSVLFADSVWELLNVEGATAPGDITWEEYVNSIGWNK